MSGFFARTASLGETLGATIPRLRDGSAPVSLTDEMLRALTPGERLVTWALEDWPSEDLERWQETISLQPTFASTALRAVSVRTETAAALWNVITERAEEEPFEATVAVLRLWFEGLFPLALADPQKVIELPRSPAQRTLGIALGLMAWRGFRTAEQIARGCLASDTGGVRLRRALLLGLAGGLPDQIVATLGTRINHSLSERDEWRLAGNQTLPWVKGGVEAPEQVFSLVEALLIASSTQSEAVQFINGLAHYPGTAETANAWLNERWAHWPGHVRAALVAVGVSGREPKACFNDRSTDVLLAALETLEGPLGNRATNQLKTLLHHLSPRVRSAVSIRLAHERSPSVVGELPPALTAQVVDLPPTTLARTPGDRIRSAFVLDEPETIPSHAQVIEGAERDAVRATLKSALGLPDVAARRAAVEGLARVGLPEDIPALLEAARWVRGLETIAVAAVRAISGPVPANELAELFHRRLKWADDEAVDHFVSLVGDAAEAELIGALQTRFYPPARAGAARALARHGFKTAIFCLRTRSLTDTNADARSAAARALESLSGTGVAAELSAGYELLHVAIDVLDRAADRGRKGGRKAIPGLRYCLANGSWRRRVMACEVLAALPTAEARSVLIEAMLDPDEDVRLAARNALVEQGWTPEDERHYTLAAVAERKLERFLLNPQRVDTDVLEQCLELGGHLFRTEIVAFLSRLEELGTWSPSEQVTPLLRLAALEPDQALAHEGGIAATLRAIDRTWQLDPHRALLGLGLCSMPSSELAAVLPNEDLGWRAREAICYAMGHIGDDTAIEHLRQNVLDPDEDVRAAALSALVRIGTTQAAEALASGTQSPFQEDAHGVAEALAAIGEPAFDTVRRLATSDWWEERRTATVALLRWRGQPQEVVNLALPMSVDCEYRVAETARKALLLHGLQPGAEAVHETLRRAGPITIGGIEPWLGLDVSHRFVDGTAGAAFDADLQASSNDALSHRVTLAGRLRRYQLRPWLTQLASGAGTSHVGLRLAATKALRELDSNDCPLCEGRGSTPCITCAGDGETRCESCLGEGTMRIACPEEDCTARERTRAIHSLTCKTCRGRGAVVKTCTCANGFVPCTVCHGGGRPLCLGCSGSGKHARMDPARTTDTDD